jgi:hypothetical protein
MHWKGDPILYTRDGGHGLIVAAHHYQFAADGSLETVHRLTLPVLRIILGKMYPHPEQAIAAHARVIRRERPTEVADE